MAAMVMTTTDAGIRVVPANEASWEDLEVVLGAARCHAARCYCQRFNMIDTLNVGGHQRLTVQAGDFFADELPGAGSYIIMLTVTRGRERTADQLSNLFGAAGFELARVIGTRSSIHIVEAKPT